MEKKSKLDLFFARLLNQKIYMTFLSGLILFHTIFYLIVHYRTDFFKGIELIKLTPSEIEYVVIKLDIPLEENSSVIIKNENEENGSTTTAGPEIGGAVKDTLGKSKIEKVMNLSPRDRTIEANISDIKLMLMRHYNSVDSIDLESLIGHYKSLLPKANYSQVESEKLKVRSYFFLTGSKAYFEIVCWTIFGVLASLLYYVSAVIRDKETMFDPEEIPSQLSKLFYAPLVTLIIVFGYQQFTTGGIEIETSKGILIVSFLLGFYSGRAIELLNRAKEVVLPYTATLLPGDTLMNAGGSATTLTVTLNVDPMSLPGESDFELISNQLTNADVKVIDPLTESVIALLNSGEDQDSIFVANGLKPGRYKITGELTTAEGLHLTAEDLIDLKENLSTELMLKFTSTSG